MRPVVRFRHKDYPHKIDPADFDNLFQHKDGLLYYIKEVDEHNIAYNWNPEPLSVAEWDLKHIDTFAIRIKWSYYGFFKATISEVKKEIERFITSYADGVGMDWFDKIHAFELFFEDVGQRNIKGEYHYVMVSLYTKKKQEE